MTEKEVEERELSDEQRGQENRNAGRHETLLFSALQAQPVPSTSPHVQSKQAHQTQLSERKRQTYMHRQTDRQTELLPSDVPDGPI